MIYPRIDHLLENVDSKYAASSSPPSARDRSTATTTTSARAASASSRRRWSRPATKNYLTVALEEIAEGKIKYQYRLTPKRRRLRGATPEASKGVWQESCSG